MISGSIICGTSIGSSGGSDISAVKSIHSAGQCSIMCGSAGGDGHIVGKRSQCDGSASDGNLTAGSTSGITESASLTTGSAGGVSGGCAGVGVGGGGCGGGGGGGVGGGVECYRYTYIELNQYIALHKCLLYIHHSLIIYIYRDAHTINIIEVKGIRCCLSWM